MTSVCIWSHATYNLLDLNSIDVSMVNGWRWSIHRLVHWVHGDGIWSLWFCFSSFAFLNSLQLVFGWCWLLCFPTVYAADHYQQSPWVQSMSSQSVPSAFLWFNCSSFIEWVDSIKHSSYDSRQFCADVCSWRGCQPWCKLISYPCADATRSELKWWITFWLRKKYTMSIDVDIEWATRLSLWLRWVYSAVGAPLTNMNMMMVSQVHSFIVNLWMMRGDVTNVHQRWTVRAAKERCRDYRRDESQTHHEKLDLMLNGWAWLQVGWQMKEQAVWYQLSMFLCNHSFWENYPHCGRNLCHPQIYIHANDLRRWLKSLVCMHLNAMRMMNEETSITFIHLIKNLCFVICNGASNISWMWIQSSLTMNLYSWWTMLLRAINVRPVDLKSKEILNTATFFQTCIMWDFLWMAVLFWCMFPHRTWVVVDKKIQWSPLQLLKKSLSLSDIEVMKNKKRSTFLFILKWRWSVDLSSSSWIGCSSIAHSSLRSNTALLMMYWVWRYFNALDALWVNEKDQPCFMKDQSIQSGRMVDVEEEGSWKALQKISLIWTVPFQFKLNQLASSTLFTGLNPTNKAESCVLSLSKAWQLGAETKYRRHQQVKEQAE